MSTDRQTDKETDRQAVKQTCYRRLSKMADDTDKLIWIQTDRQTGSQTDLLQTTVQDGWRHWQADMNTAVHQSTTQQYHN